MIHTIIKEERRKAPLDEQGNPVVGGRYAFPSSGNKLIDTGTKDKDGRPVYDVQENPPVLHHIGECIDDPSNVLYAAEWDGRAPYINVLIGTFDPTAMQWAGWPMITKEEYEKMASDSAIDTSKLLDVPVASGENSGNFNNNVV